MPATDENFPATGGRASAWFNDIKGTIVALIRNISIYWFATLGR